MTPAQQCGPEPPGENLAGPGAALILLAAGSGQRSGQAGNKVLLPLAGRRVLTWSLDSTAAVPDILCTVVVLRPGDDDEVARVLQAESPERRVIVVRGGGSRHDSELAGLRALSTQIRSGGIDVVVIHDAARPLATTELFRRVIAAARLHGGALPGLPVVGLVPLDGSAPERGSSDTVAVQTPQAFRAGPLLDAYEAAAHVGFVGGDTAACIERFGRLRIACLDGEAHNIKITFADDLSAAEALAQRRVADHVRSERDAAD